MKLKELIFTLGAVVFTGLLFGQCGPLATAYNQNNGQDGIMFDVQAITSVEITSWDINCGGTTHTFEIYYRPGTHVGFQNSAAGWTLLGTAAGVTGPVNVATPIPIPISVVLCAGDIGAFYITSTSTSGSIDYTNGVAVGNIIAADANLQIKCGTGKDYAFGASFTPRNPNVTAHYNCLSMSCCAVQTISANIGACVAGAYSTTGQVTFLNPPAGGQLIIEDCNGFQQVFNPPFVSPVNYNITGQTPDNAPCDITAYFTADPGCTITQAYTAPMPCGCSAAWTTTTACSTDPPINLSGLITGDTGGTWSGTGVTGTNFNPGVGTQSITYTAPLGCMITQSISVTSTAVASWSIPTGLCNTSAPVNLNTYITGTPGGTWSGTGVTGNMFDPSVGTQNITYTAGTAPCDDAVTQTITVGSMATATWTPPVGLCPAAPLFDLNTTITGTPGGTWSGTGVTGNMFDPSVGTQSVTYTAGTAPCTDAVTQSIVIISGANASWNIPTGVCIGDAPIDLTAFITGDPGGTWSGTGVTGNTFDPSVGSQNITYSVGTAPCDANSTQLITVATALDASWNIPTNICETDAAIDMSPFITGDAGGTWSGTGVTGNMFDPSVGTQSLTYTVGTGGCQATLSQSVTVDVTPDPSWATLTLCASSTPVNLAGQITGTAGGTWSGTGVTGSVFDPFFGTQNITYTATSGACTASSTQAITVVSPQVTVAPSSTSCFGVSDASVTASVTGGSGNYTYLWNPSGQGGQTATNLGGGTYQVTVTDVSGGCTTTANVTITEPAEIVLTMLGLDACSPALGSASVNATGGVGGFTYNWTPVASNSTTVSGLDSVMATVVVTDANGCTNTDSVFVTVWDAPVVTTTPDTTVVYGEFITLFAMGGVDFEWTPDYELSCSDCPTPVASPTQNTVYCVEVTDVHGCVSTECITVDVEIICGDIFVPGAFSPNNDGENDLLCVYSDCMESMTFSIYNRWGEKVYETTTMNICWDGTWEGKVLNSGVFVYMLNGYLINGQSISQSGNISLIR